MSDLITHLEIITPLNTQCFDLPSIFGSYTVFLLKTYRADSTTGDFYESHCSDSIGESDRYGRFDLSNGRLETTRNRYTLGIVFHNKDEEHWKSLLTMYMTHNIYNSDINVFNNTDSHFRLINVQIKYICSNPIQMDLIHPYNYAKK